ncbi:MAG TPA: ferrous iron transport protein A [Desulfonatronum sp.]|nr:ferrous iron transport protein A [Desulfonatronum sp.]
MAELIGLRQMKINQQARIVAVQAQGDLGRRIREMGLIPGTVITVIGRAPLRDPVALRLLDFTLTLRNNEADHIIVDPLAAASGALS